MWRSYADHMASIFARIVAGEIPCHRVWEDEDHLAFLDLNPIQPGHTLVIPKVEVAYLFDLEAEAFAALWGAVRAVEAKVRAATAAKRVVVEVVGYEVPHVHVHLIPTRQLSDYPVPPRGKMADEELAAMAAGMREA